MKMDLPMFIQSYVEELINYRKDELVQGTEVTTITVLSHNKLVYETVFRSSTILQSQWQEHLSIITSTGRIYLVQQIRSLLSSNASISSFLS